MTTVKSLPKPQSYTDSDLMYIKGATLITDFIHITLPFINFMQHHATSTSCIQHEHHTTSTSCNTCLTNIGGSFYKEKKVNKHDQ